MEKNEIEYLDQVSCEAKGYAWTIVYFSSDTTWSRNNPGHFRGVDYSSDYLELWGYPSFESPRLYETLTDYNSNDKWDVGEPFIDDNNNGIWDRRINPINVVTMQSGYKASNITFPDETPEIEFIFPDTTKSVLNRGNGDRLYNIVNEYDLTDAVLRFEINAGLDPIAFGDSTGSFATLDPSLYIYEVLSLDNHKPDSSWDKYADDLSPDSLQYYYFIIGLGAWIGTIMLFNVWILIWPNQKKVLGIVEATAEEKAKAARIAFLASRTNTMLSIPMLMCMVSAGHGFFM